jgi:hypothetical protein
MAPRRQPSARVLAAAAIASFAVALIVVIAISVGGGGGGSPAVEVPAPPARGVTSSQTNSGEAASEYYVVRPGDNFVRIAKRTGLSVQELQRLNPNLDPQGLVSGQRVRLGR